MKIILNFISLTFLLFVLVFVMLRTAEPFSNYRGVARWDSKIYKPWIGTKMYPVSKNCNCPDNYDFVDNKCINREYPYKVSQPFCYDNIE
jgi:hypothetical protein